MLSVELEGRLIFKKIGVLVLVARSLCYFGGTEASFVFEKRFTLDLLIPEVRICEYLSNFTELQKEDPAG